MIDEPTGYYVVSWRCSDGHVESKEVDSITSMLLVLQNAMIHHKSIWVREDPGGAIVLVYDAYGNLQRL